MEKGIQKFDSLVANCTHETYNLTSQMMDLEAVKQAVVNLRNYTDEIHHKGWNKSGGLAENVLKEIQQNATLIDLAFASVFKDMSSTIKTLDKVVTDLHTSVFSSDK